MSIKTFFQLLAEKITGRKCAKCAHNINGRCCHPNGDMFLRCWHSVTRPGFVKRGPRYLRSEDVKLTHEERHQLQKIEDVLQEAGDTARESGLVGAPPVCHTTNKKDYYHKDFYCPGCGCGVWLASYTTGRGWEVNGNHEVKMATCWNCGQAIDWSGVPYPDKETEV